MKKDLFLKISFTLYLVLAFLFSWRVLAGTVWIILSKDTEKLIVATIMGVSGSILGFLVIYLSMSFEAIRRNYGKYALRIFRRDFYIWSLCIFFSLILLLGLTALLSADNFGKWWIWAFNLTCLSFAFGVALVVPFGNAILGKSGSNILIREMIDEINEDDFKEPPPIHSFPADIYWAITESPDNKIDILSNVLFHHISESDYKIASQIMLDFINLLQKLATEKGADTEKMLSRFLDILQTAFDIAKRKDDFFTLKMILYAYHLSGILLAEKKLGKTIIEKLYDGIGNMIKYFIETEKEDMLTESFWTYYNVAENQLSRNLPSENEIWEKDDKGRIVNINTNTAWEKDAKFETIDKGASYDFPRLVDRTFLCRNHYITENSIRMLTSFILMVTANEQMGPLQKFKTGSSLCWNAEKSIKRFITSNNALQFGYLKLYLGSSSLLTVLRENSRFADSAFSTYTSIVKFILEQDVVNKFDLDDIGGLTRLIIANSEKITKANDFVKELLVVQVKIRVHLLMKLKNPSVKESEGDELKNMVEGMQDDLKSYVSTFSRKALNNTTLGDLINSYQI